MNGVASPGDGLRLERDRMPTGGHFGECLEIVAKWHMQHDERAVVSIGIEEDVSAPEVESAGVVFAEIARHGVVRWIPLADRDHGVVRPGDHRRGGDTADTTVAAFVDLEDPFPGLDLWLARGTCTIAVGIRLAPLLEYDG